MYKKTFTLEQHTPLIHFQALQNGANIRATEIKPKLDKFIWLQLINENANKENAFSLFKHLLIGYEPNNIQSLRTRFLNGFFAFNYSIKVLSEGQKINSQHRIISENHNGVHYTKTILEFKAWQPEILMLIERLLRNFLIIENFGKRQNKGYGCFYLKGTTKEQLIACLKNISGDCIFMKNESVSDFEQEINKSWSRLKSGQNKPYEKSRIFRYASENKIKWEKRFIKLEIEDLIAISENNYPALYRKREPLDCSVDELKETYTGLEDNPDVETDINSEYNYYFMRALLGLPELYEFQAVDDKYQVMIKSESEEVDRFKAPVTFKVFNNHIYAFPNQFSDQILGQGFIFSVYLKSEKKKKLKEFTLRIPRQFNLNSFLSKYLPTVGFNKII
ncbi:MAG: hypothetical protein U0X40_07500 [Ferruginibacter sp.]